MPQEKGKNQESDKLREKEAKKEERKEIRRIEKIKKGKDKRMKSYRKYGRGQQKHSTMGMRSCMQAAGAVLLFGLAIFFAFLLHGNAGFTGAMSLCRIWNPFRSQGIQRERTELYHLQGGTWNQRRVTVNPCDYIYWRILGWMNRM